MRLIKFCKITLRGDPKIGLQLETLSSHIYRVESKDLIHRRETNFKIVLIMKLWWIVSVAVSFLFLCAIHVVALPSRTVAEAASSDVSSDEFEKKFVPFNAKNNNTNNNTKNLRQGAFINVPVNCPPDKVKVGNRCRAFF